ncbi:MAG: hypothetical protein HDQ87_06455 [Clostridia bacterium]|nr:hypothetical protein [Clostridia bacterium]
MSESAKSSRARNKRRRHRRNQGRMRTKVCGNKNLNDPMNINIDRDGPRELISDQASLDRALAGYPNTDRIIAVQGGTPESPLVIRHKSRVPPVVLSGSCVIARGEARVGVYGDGSVITAFGYAKIWVHGRNHAVIYDEVKAEICGTSTVCAYDHTHTKLCHEAAGKFYDQARCRCWQNASADAYDESVIKLHGNALAVRFSDEAQLLNYGAKKGEKPYFDECGTTQPVMVNTFEPSEAGGQSEPALETAPA